MKTEVHTLPHQTNYIRQIIEFFCKKELQNLNIIKNLCHEQQGR